MITADDIVKYASYNKYKNITCPYEGTPFKTYKNLSSKRKGAAFEAIFKEYAESIGYVVKKSYSSDHDCVLIKDDVETKVEIKGSMLWGEKGHHMRWQQIRPEQDYDAIAFLAIFPHGIEIYFAAKDDVTKFVDVQDDRGGWIYNQHGGNRIRSGTFSIDGKPSDFPFMKPFEEI